MMSSPAREAAFDLAAVLGSVKQGTLRMFGDWFGRPWDNVHIVRAVRADERDLIVGFDEEEELAISDPAGWSFDAETFRVSGASRVTWRWYYYGRPRQPVNRFTIEHWVEENGVLRARSDAGWYTPDFSPSISEPVAELLLLGSYHRARKISRRVGLSQVGRPAGGRMQADSSRKVNPRSRSDALDPPIGRCPWSVGIVVHAAPDRAMCMSRFASVDVTPHRLAGCLCCARSQ